MGSWGELFSLDPNRVWLNASHQGPLPNAAAAAVSQMVAWKQQPVHLSTPEPFTAVPERLRAALAALIGASTDQVVLANSASYGLHLFANGLPLDPGDEVIVATNDFPSDVLPWMRRRDDGVVLHRIQPDGQVLTAAEIEPVITGQTRVVCLTWVHSLSGHVADLEAIGELCRARDVLLLVNVAQGVGAIPLDVSGLPIDGVAGVGFKYLCGPYGTGLAWIGERLAERLEANKLYWLSALTADDLARSQLDLDAIDVPDTAARHDIFGTANFFNFAALDAAVEVVSSVGVPAIRAHNLGLAEMLEAGLDPARYRVQARGDQGAMRSSILFVEPTRRAAVEVFTQLRDAGIDVAHRVGKLRFSPHFYNDTDDIDRAVAVLTDCG